MGWGESLIVSPPLSELIWLIKKSSNRYKVFFNEGPVKPTEQENAPMLKYIQNTT